MRSYRKVMGHGTNSVLYYNHILYCVLQEMLKYTSVGEGSEQLQLAVDTMLSVLKYVNDLMHQIAITGFHVSPLYLSY